MPEGDSVYQLSRRLQFLVGREVLSTSLRVPRYATTRFDGSTCERIWPYGKHLHMQFGTQILHTHLEMEGTWSMHLAGDKWRKPGHTARVVLRFEGAPKPRPIEIVGHELGLVEVYPVSEYAERIAYLGPDILDPAFDIDDGARRLAADPLRPVGLALLDQRVIAGLGNEYRAEICFLAGVHPAVPMREVDARAVVELSHRLITANRNSPIRVTTGVRRAGENSYVFGRNHRPCRRCGTLIEHSFLGSSGTERVIWWCPHCQPAPSSFSASGG